MPSPDGGGIGYEPSGNWTVGRVTVDGLRVRMEPRLDAEPVFLPVADAQVEYQLAAGEQVLRYQKAGSHDGYRWWEIFGTPRGFSDLTLHGYVADGRVGEDPWLVRVHDYGCPADPTVDELGSLVPFMRVACYDRFPIKFQAYSWTIPGEGYGGACGFDPVTKVDWLQCDNINHNWVNATGNGDATFLLHYNPEVLAAPDILENQGKRFTITGHFADGASDRCAAGLTDADEWAVAYWNCAMQFVVDRLKPS